MVLFPSWLSESSGLKFSDDASVGSFKPMAAKLELRLEERVFELKISIKELCWKTFLDSFEKRIVSRASFE